MSGCGFYVASYRYEWLRNDLISLIFSNYFRKMVAFILYFWRAKKCWDLPKSSEVLIFLGDITRAANHLLTLKGDLLADSLCNIGGEKQPRT